MLLIWDNFQNIKMYCYNQVKDIKDKLPKNLLCSFKLLVYFINTPFLTFWLCHSVTKNETFWTIKLTIIPWNCGQSIARSSDWYTSLLIITGQNTSNQNPLIITIALINYPVRSFVRQEFSISEKREFADYQVATLEMPDRKAS